MSWLPNENLLDVFAFLSDVRLLRSVSFVCHRFWRLSELALFKFHPMVAKSVRIGWDPKNASHYFFVQSVKCAVALSNLALSVGPSDNSSSNWPPSLPPPNIVGIRRIRMEGKLTREVLEFLSRCASKISESELDFENLESFLAELSRQKIHLDEFFAVFGSRFSALWLDCRFVSFCLFNDFLCNDFVLRCSFLSIFHPFSAFDAKCLENWLNWPSENGRKKNLTIICNGKRKNEADKSIEQLVQMLFDQCHRHDEKIKNASFTVELHNLHTETLTQFEEGQMNFKMINTQFWVLNSNTEANAGEVKTIENIGTFVDVGTFDY